MKCWARWSTAGIKIARRNINNLKYADDTTLMAESKEELKSLLMKVKEESEKAGLKLRFKTTKIMASHLHFMAYKWGRNGNSDRLYFHGLQNHCGRWLQSWIKRLLYIQVWELFIGEISYKVTFLGSQKLRYLLIFPRPVPQPTGP